VYRSIISAHKPKILNIPLGDMDASSNLSEAIEKSIPNWKVTGDWFDVCKCSVPCPCTFAQAPSYGDCDGVLAYHIKNGIYGNTTLDGLNVLAQVISRVISGLARPKQPYPYSLMKKPMKSSEKLYI
jgi:hypothetical protein